MFILTLKYDAFQERRRRELRGLVTCARDGLTPDYWVSLGLGGAGEFTRGTLSEYRRWSEPVRAFLARSLRSALDGLSEPLALPCSSFEMFAYDWRTGALVDRIEGDCGSADFSDALTPVARAFANPWEAAFNACAFDAFGTADLPPYPGASPPRLHRTGTVRYFRTSDLPLEAMVAVERSLPDGARPCVPGVPDAVHPWALERFLSSRTPELGAGQRWSWP